VSTPAPLATVWRIEQAALDQHDADGSLHRTALTRL
jgi:hypothetical protein